MGSLRGGAIITLNKLKSKNYKEKGKSGRGRDN